MTDGFESAKAQRNLLERLGEKIPGYRGFQDRELRREVDRIQRQHLSERLTELKGALRHKTGEYTDAGRIGQLQAFDRLERRMDGLSQAVRFADYGNTGLFDPEKIGEEKLRELYEFDLAVLDEIEGLELAVSAVPAPGTDDPEPALDQVTERLEALQRRWQRRKAVVSDVVQTS